MRENLLQKRDGLGCLILVWHWQIDIFQKQHQSIALLGFQDSSTRESSLYTEFMLLVYDLLCVNLTVTVNYCLFESDIISD